MKTNRSAGPLPTALRCLALASTLLILSAWAQARAGQPAADAANTTQTAGDPAAAASPGEHQPEVWLCAGDRIADLLRPDAQWPYVRQHLTGIKLYVGQLAQNRRRPDEATAERLRQLVRLVKAQHYQVAVELGGCLDFSPMDDTSGEWSARHELAAIDNFYAAGGRVDFLDLDGPIRRLLHPDRRTDRKRFDSIDKAADELVDALRIHRTAHPETRYWLLTNFPNWGWRGDVSYHARGPERQDYGDYDRVVRIVLDKLRAAEIPLEGVTVDNPYDYLVGEYKSVNLDPKSVDWLGRVRAYEDFARSQHLSFNLIVNSERGGNQSDALFCRETLQMVDTYLKAGGRPTRWFVQSWYPYPKQISPESSPDTMTALVKQVIERVTDAPQPAPGPEAPATGLAAPANPPIGNNSQATAETSAPPSGAPDRIVLRPQPGAMQVRAEVPGLDGQAFSLGIPETIGCREAMLVNFPEAKVQWQGPDEHGVVSCMWGPGGRISYELRLVPAADFVDVEMTVRNHTEFTWHDVFAFDCLNPIEAKAFQDWKLERTYMSKQGKPLRMAETTRVQGSMPTVQFYLPERVPAGSESVFVRGFGATSPDRTDGNWIVTLSESAGAYMAAAAPQIAFLFDNLDRCCLHAAPSFGHIGPRQASTVVCRLYLAKGGLDDFLRRHQADRQALAGRQKWAPAAADARSARPHGRMEEMSPDELEQVLAKAPVAYVPLGTFEHHGWHLPVCFDGIKAHALCERVAERTGGTVLPTFFYGTGGGHVGYKWTLMLPETQIAPLIEATLDHLARQGFRVVVLLTGHYPKEQVDMAHRLAQEAQARHPQVRFLGLTEPEITTPEPGDRYGGDHAAMYETSIALALNPQWVGLDRLKAGRDPAQATLPDTPPKDGPAGDPTHPLYAIYGHDPRTSASPELGEKLVTEIVSRLAAQVQEALKAAGDPKQPEKDGRPEPNDEGRAAPQD
ncbi:MAG: creatininase family protein [Thermoguttaceae bacterium]